MGMACSQRPCHGSSASSAGTNASRITAPISFAAGDSILRERNQRNPSSPTMAGARKIAIPKPCSSTSLKPAPTMPIQLWAGPGAGAAVLSDGSSGE